MLATGIAHAEVGAQLAHNTLASIAQRASHALLQQKGSSWQTLLEQALSLQPGVACGAQHGDCAAA